MIDYTLPHLEFLSALSYNWETAEVWMWSQTSLPPQTDAGGRPALPARQSPVKMLGRKTHSETTSHFSSSPSMPFP